MAAPAVDGHAASAPTGGSSQSVTLTTTQANDLVILCVFNERGSGGAPSRTVSGVSGGGLTWARRAQVTNPTPVGAPNSLEVWWAVAPAPLAAVSITVTLTGVTDDWGLVAFGVAGDGTRAPSWDTNPSLPATAIGSSPSCAGVSTTQANDLLLAVFGETANSATTRASVPSGFTAVDGAGTSGGGLFGQCAAAGRQVTVPQSGLTVAWGGGASSSDLIVDAVTADAAADLLPWLARAPAPAAAPAAAPGPPAAGWRPAFGAGLTPPVRHALIRFWRGPEARMPVLEDGEPAWASDTKSLWMGSASGNVRIGP